MKCSTSIMRILSSILLFCLIYNYSFAQSDEQNETRKPKMALSFSLNPAFTLLQSKLNKTFDYYIRFDKEIDNRDRIYLQTNFLYSFPLAQTPKRAFNSDYSPTVFNRSTLKLGYMLFNNDGNLYLDFAFQGIFERRSRTYVDHKYATDSTSGGTIHEGFASYNNLFSSIGIGVYGGIGANLKLVNHFYIRPYLGVDIQYFHPIKNQTSERVSGSNIQSDPAIRSEINEDILSNWLHNKNWIKVGVSLSYQF